MTDIRLKFDGITLKALDTNNGTVIDSWDAISGRPGSQSADLSNVVDTGPIPTGTWSVSTSNITDMNDLPLWRQLLSETGVVSPRGGVSSWGDTFLRIDAVEDTETHGRSGFHIHGGSEAGSAGCIDLVGGNDEFFDFLKNYDGEVELIVDYSGNANSLSSTNHPLLQQHDHRQLSPEFQLLERLYDGDIEATQWFISQFPSCFGPQVMIDMWPLDAEFAPDPNNLNKVFDQDAVRAKVWKKPISLMKVGDWVVSFDKDENLVPGYVPRTMTNDVKILLDFHGTEVTPGHVYYRPDSKLPDKFETLIDVLRDDGVIQKQDGSLVRAATNVPVGDPLDGFVKAITGTLNADGTVDAKQRGRIRLGTRFVVHNGKERKSYCVADLIKAGGGLVGDDELIHVGDATPMSFHWEFGDTLPKPEDYVLAVSGTSLEKIYKASEWEGQRPHLPTPMVMDGGPVQALSHTALSATPRNEPLNVAHHDPATQLAKPQRTMNRKQRKAMEAKARKGAKASKRVIG